MYNKKKLRQQKIVERALVLIAKENNWEVQNVIDGGLKQHIIYKIPSD
jgi:hypothetical protein